MSLLSRPLQCRTHLFDQVLKLKTIKYFTEIDIILNERVVLEDNFFNEI